MIPAIPFLRQWSSGISRNFFDGFFSAFFFTGYFPKAPGTFTSFITALLILLFAPLTGYWSIFIFAAAVSIAGVFITGISEKRNKSHDPGWITLDEAAGMALALSLLQLASLPVFQRIILVSTAFVLFRFFDILKPFPIRQIQGLKGGLGIMSDDILAGIMANLLARVFFYIFFKVELFF